MDWFTKEGVRERLLFDPFRILNDFICGIEGCSDQSRIISSFPKNTKPFNLRKVLGRSRNRKMRPGCFNYHMVERFTDRNFIADKDSVRVECMDQLSLSVSDCIGHVVKQIFYQWISGIKDFQKITEGQVLSILIEQRVRIGIRQPFCFQ